MTEEKEEKKAVFFTRLEILTCPKCCEAKKLGNKYYNSINTISNRICECALEMTVENVEFVMKKFNGLYSKLDSVQKEFIAVLRGRTKCCCPQWMLNDYLNAWELK